MINIYIEPYKTVSWRQFIKQYPMYSISLDGHCNTGPKFDANTKHININHHEGVNRLATRSTSAQVITLIKQGLLDFFTKDGQVHMNIYINDLDQDTALSIWLLQNWTRVIGIRSEPLINKLVYIEDLLDTTACSYPFNPDSDILQSIEWIFEPCYNIHTKIADFERDLEDTLLRISKYTIGEGKKLATEHVVGYFYTSDKWSLVGLYGHYARLQMFNQGVKAYVADNRNGTYTIGKLSQFVDFPILKLYNVLNKAEGIHYTDLNRWGGGDIIGGSPRGRQSNLSHQDLIQLINKELSN